MSTKFAIYNPKSNKYVSFLSYSMINLVDPESATLYSSLNFAKARLRNKTYYCGAIKLTNKDLEIHELEIKINVLHKINYSPKIK